MPSAARQPPASSTTTPPASRRSPGSACCWRGTRHGSGPRSPDVRQSTRSRHPRPAGGRVRRFIADATRAALEGAPGAAVVLRGDSTCAVIRSRSTSASATSSRPPAGPCSCSRPRSLRRAGDSRWESIFDRDGRRTALHETEYARDGVFAYSSARLLEWAEERSDGHFRARAGRELHLDVLRTRGPAAVTDAARSLRLGRPGGARTRRRDAGRPRDRRRRVPRRDRRPSLGDRALRPDVRQGARRTIAPGLVPPPSAREGVLVVCALQ